MQEIDITKRLKYLEERVSMFNNIIESIDSTTRLSVNDIKEDLNNIKRDINELKEDINNIEIKLKAITDQLSLFATTDQLKTITSMMDYINPFDFVTKKEVEKIIDKKLREYFDELYNNDNK
ncbi:hypothetical protein MJ1_0512 [Nanobdella aerobiophila]|uniref:Uncharacterized protein n=1 Tax=Nanobdella aerobiophila TaxID=2586965 RepID=A0A915SYA8_9ARCH|nr:hypothetical protein [Nanobdella aerobiophila]BBL45665.1 hypothetical protein MJ1_0512 [Nanobdella aerobiophila]